MNLKDLNPNYFLNNNKNTGEEGEFSLYSLKH